MKLALSLLVLLSTMAQAEENPFLPPLQRLAPVPVVGNLQALSGAGAGASGIPVASVVDPVVQRKKNDLMGARMVAIIDQEEVWYRPEQGIYVRYPANGLSISTLEAPKVQDDIQQIKQAIAPVESKSTIKKGAKGKSW
jgi:hypothetical protein